MAGQTGSPPSGVGAGNGADVLGRLTAEPWRFGFFAALRWIECANPGKPRIGTSVHASEDPIRLGQEPSLAFAPATLAKAVAGANGLPPRLLVWFFGVFGANGPLPHHLTEYARSRMRNEGDPTFGRFLDVFHHRLLSLFYRSWSQAQPTTSLDRPTDDRFSSYVGATFGMGGPALRNRDALPDFTKLHFAGRLAAQTRNAEGLEAMLSGFLNLPARIEEFSGQWLRLPAESLCRLGESPETGTLGRTAVVGSRIWDFRQKFRIVLGPLSFADFERLLPGSRSGTMDRITALVRNYVGDEFAFDVQLVLRKEEIPPLNLAGGAMLGFTTWTTSRPPEDDSRDLVLNPLGDVA